MWLGVLLGKDGNTDATSRGCPNLIVFFWSAAVDVVSRKTQGRYQNARKVRGIIASTETDINGGWCNERQISKTGFKSPTVFYFQYVYDCAFGLVGGAGSHGWV